MHVYIYAGSPLHQRLTNRSLREDCDIHEGRGDKNREVTFEDNDRLKHCRVIATRSLVKNKDDPRAFIIPCTIGVVILC